MNDTPPALVYHVGVRLSSRRDFARRMQARVEA
jgi:hypothetical protein